MVTALRIFTPAYYARLQDIERDHWWYRGMRDLSGRWLDADLGERTGLRVLDVGCGAGYMLRWLARYATPRPVLGIDFDSSALLWARQHGGVTARASALGLPFKDGAFDLIHCADVLQHLPVSGGDSAALAECRRVLAPGGLLLVRTNAAPGLGDAAGDPSYQRYRLSTLSTRVVSCGFEVVRSTHVNTLPSLIGTVRLALQRSRSADVDHHQHGPGLPRMPRSGAENRILTGVLAAEALLLSLPRVSSPFGHSALVLARRR